MNKNVKLLLYAAFIGIVVLFSCHPKKPDFQLSKDFSLVEERNGTIIRKLTIERYDMDSNFAGVKNFYIKPDKKGSNKVSLFDDNTDYYFNGDSLTLEKGYKYVIDVRTLGHADTLTFSR